MRSFQIFTAATGLPLALALVLGQAPLQSPSEVEPIFRSGTRIVEVSILVTDKNGPVMGLTKEDFAIRDNGKPQPISFFTGPQGGRSLSDSTTPLSPENQPAPGSAVIVLDWLNTPIENQLYARRKTLDMLEQITVQDHVALGLNLRHLSVLHDFTQDTATLVESIRALRGTLDTPETPHAALAGALPGIVTIGAGQAKAMNAMAQVDKLLRADATHDSVDRIIKILSGRPGRRSLIWVSNSVPLSGALLQRMLANNIALYLINARGLSVKQPPDPYHPERVRINTYADGLIAERIEKTGGRYYTNRNDLDMAMREALDETRQSYILGYYVPADAKLDAPNPKKPAPEPRQIRVETPKRKLTLRYRRTYDPYLIEP